MTRKVGDIYRKHFVALTIGPLLKLIEVVFDLLIPLFMKAIIDLNQYGDPSLIPNQFSQKLGSFIRLFGIWIQDRRSSSQGSGQGRRDRTAHCTYW